MMRRLCIRQSKRWISQPLAHPLAWHQYSKHPPGTLSIKTLALDYEELGPCEVGRDFRPAFIKRKDARLTKPKAGRQSVMDPSVGRRLSAEEDLWNHECLVRVKSTGVSLRGGRVQEWPYDKNGDINLGHPFWDHPYLLRAACKGALVKGYPASVEITARKLCAETKDQRYPAIYRSLNTQAHILYLLGRIELEREPLWRVLGHYMLSISAGLGQLDAALLLHQLHKIDKQLSLQDEQQAVIAKAAQDRLDWRAMVAHVEYVVSNVKVAPGRAPGRLIADLKNSGFEQLGLLEGQQLEECLKLLSEAMSMTRPSSSDLQEDVKILPDESIDVDALESFDPPYRLLYNLTFAQTRVGNYEESIVKLHEHAMRTGALAYRDPKMAGNYVRWFVANYEKYPTDWVECAEIAAVHLDADVCVHLSQYYLQKEGWYPSLAARTLEEYKQKEHKRGESGLDFSETNASRASEQEKHDTIMEQKDERLLAAQEGFKWMRVAAQLNLQSAAKMLNRYCIIAGLLRQNGFMEEGRAVLLEAKEEINKCVGDGRKIDQALRNLDEYIDHWDSRLVHHLLTPRDIAGLLEGVQKV